MLHLIVHLTVQSWVHLYLRMNLGALKDALSNLDVKKVHLRLHLRAHVRLHLNVALDGVPEVALVSVTEDALEGRSEGAPKSVLRDLDKDVPEGSFEGTL